MGVDAANEATQFPHQAEKMEGKWGLQEKSQVKTYSGSNGDGEEVTTDQHSRWESAGNGNASRNTAAWDDASASKAARSKGEEEKEQKLRVEETRGRVVLREVMMGYQRPADMGVTKNAIFRVWPLPGFVLVLFRRR